MILTRFKIFNQHVLFYSYFMLAVAILIFLFFFLQRISGCMHVITNCGSGR